MNPVHLRTFLAVRKHLNYTRAAEELFLTQPAVSRQVRQLEKELGLALFEQIGKTLHLTDAGKTLASEAEVLLGHLERVAESLRSHRTLERGRISIGASSTPGLYLIPEVIGRFRRRFPKVEFHYCIENSLRIEQKILHNEIDLGVVGVAPGAEAILCEPLIDDQVVCFASPTHPLARRREIDPRALTKETWVIREKGAATRQLMERWLARRRIDVGHAIELSCPEGIKALVAADVGVSYMSLHGLSEEIRRGRLVPLDVRDLSLSRSLYLIRHRDKHISPVMDAFSQLLKRMGRPELEANAMRKSSRRVRSR
jgi:DNA-binding transcriptional LysR family regulator